MTTTTTADLVAALERARAFYNHNGPLFADRALGVVLDRVSEGRPVAEGLSILSGLLEPRPHADLVASAANDAAALEPPAFQPLPLALLKVVLGDVAASPLCQTVEPQ